MRCFFAFFKKTSPSAAGAGAGTAAAETGPLCVHVNSWDCPSVVFLTSPIGKVTAHFIPAETSKCNLYIDGGEGKLISFRLTQETGDETLDATYTREADLSLEGQEQLLKDVPGCTMAYLRLPLVLITPVTSPLLGGSWVARGGGGGGRSKGGSLTSDPFKPAKMVAGGEVRAIDPKCGFPSGRRYALMKKDDLRAGGVRKPEFQQWRFVSVDEGVMGSPAYVEKVKVLMSNLVGMGVAFDGCMAGRLPVPFDVVLLFKHHPVIPEELPPSVFTGGAGAGAGGPGRSPEDTDFERRFMKFNLVSPQGRKDKVYEAMWNVCEAYRTDGNPQWGEEAFHGIIPGIPNAKRIEVLEKGSMEYGRVLRASYVPLERLKRTLFVHNIDGVRVVNSASGEAAIPFSFHPTKPMHKNFYDMLFVFKNRGYFGKYESGEVFPVLMTLKSAEAEFEETMPLDIESSVFKAQGDKEIKIYPISYLKNPVQAAALFARYTEEMKEKVYASIEGGKAGFDAASPEEKQKALVAYTTSILSPPGK